MASCYCVWRLLNKTPKAALQLSNTANGWNMSEKVIKNWTIAANYMLTWSNPDA